jgi:hypothetical protein
MIEGAERIAAPQVATSGIFALIHKLPVYQSLIHDHFGAQTTITLGRSGTITLGHNPIIKTPFIFPVVVTRYVDSPAG